MGLVNTLSHAPSIVAAAQVNWRSHVGCKCAGARVRCASTTCSGLCGSCRCHGCSRRENWHRDSLALILPHAQHCHQIGVRQLARPRAQALLLALSIAQGLRDRLFSSRRRFCSSRNFVIWPKIGSSSMQARSMVGIAAALEEAGGRLSTGVAPMLPGTTALLVFIGVGLWRLASLCSSCSSSRCCSSSDMAAGTRDPGASLQRMRTTVGGRHWLEHPHESVTSF